MQVKLLPGSERNVNRQKTDKPSIKKTISKNRKVRTHFQHHHLSKNIGIKSAVLENKTSEYHVEKEQMMTVKSFKAVDEDTKSYKNA